MFYSRCPRAQPLVKVGGTCPRAPWSRCPCVSPWCCGERQCWTLAYSIRCTHTHVNTVLNLLYKIDWRSLTLFFTPCRKSASQKAAKYRIFLEALWVSCRSPKRERKFILEHFTRTAFYLWTAGRCYISHSNGSGRRRRLLPLGARSNFVPVSVITVFVFLTETWKKEWVCVYLSCYWKSDVKSVVYGTRSKPTHHDFVKIKVWSIGVRDWVFHSQITHVMHSAEDQTAA